MKYISVLSVQGVTRMIQSLCIGGMTHGRIIPDHQILITAAVFQAYPACCMKNVRPNPAGANEEILMGKNVQYTLN